MPTIAFGDQVWDAADPIFEEDEGHFRVEDIVTVVEHEHVKETDLEVDTIDADDIVTGDLEATTIETSYVKSDGIDVDMLHTSVMEVTDELIYRNQQYVVSNKFQPLDLANVQADEEDAPYDTIVTRSLVNGTRINNLQVRADDTTAFQSSGPQGNFPGLFFTEGWCSERLTMLEDGVGHLRIFSFGDKTDEELERALKEFRAAEGTGLVLDLRNNPGGLLRAVVDVANQFLDDGLILYEVNAQGERRDWETKSGGDGLDISLVVLVNQFSASASEVLSGALMDHDRAEVIGVTTFGKGSVNTLKPLSDGSGVYFTIGRWYTPLGTLIEGEGITPDIFVEIPPNSIDDVQLSRTVEILKRQVVQAR